MPFGCLWLFPMFSIFLGLPFVKMIRFLRVAAWILDIMDPKRLAWILDPSRSGGCDACPQGHGSEWCNAAWQDPTKKGRKRLKHHEEDKT